MKNDLISRRKLYSEISTQLGFINDNKLPSLFKDDNKNQGWGTNQIIKLGNKKVFVKRIPITDLEYKNQFSTKNLYKMPCYYNYGVGSAGFGVYRELLTHIKTTNWVLDGSIENFPLMYHYRILPVSKKTNKINMIKHNQYVNYWNSNKNISKYILDRSKANYEMILFLEYIPYTFSTWILKNVNKLDKVMKEMQTTISFLRKNGVIHFDMHLQNIVTDGEKTYLTDFGLVLDKQFELNKTEQLFFKNHSHYDYGEFIFCIGISLFRVAPQLFNRKRKRILTSLDKYGIRKDTKQTNWIDLIVENLDEIKKEGVVKLDKKYVDILSKNKEIFLLVHDFFRSLRFNKRKNTKFENAKLIRLLNKLK